VPATLPPPRRRSGKTAPAAGTSKALHYLESYLSDKSNRKSATVALLGCSVATAARLTSRQKRYTSPMKMVWVIRICAAVGKPLDGVLGLRKPIGYRQALVGWVGVESGAPALQAAYDCANMVVQQAFLGFSLSGDSVVSHLDGVPRKLTVSLSPNPSLTIYGGKYDYYRIIITAREKPGGGSQMWIKTLTPGGTELVSVRLTGETLRDNLKLIYGYTKHISKELIGESTQRPEGSAG
tara:strand:- start:9448 stop:10161 length:714 start_codon:yes stop_codon:yes gene_type:complete